MKKLNFIIIFCLMIAGSAALFAQDKPDVKKAAAEPLWKKELMRDVVSIKGNTMIIEEGGLLIINNEVNTRLKVKIRGEAPVTGVVSRDNFVSITTSLYNSIFIGVVAGLIPDVPASKLGSAFEFRNDEQVKVNPDITVTILMDVKGVTLQVSNSHNAEVQKYPLAWEEYFNSAAAEAEKNEPVKKAE